MPKVSVIIPTYNREKYISRAIQSVLDQTFKDFEIIVVDNNSTDNTKNMVAAFENRVKYFIRNQGDVSSARNFGIQQSTGGYIAFLDSDDFWAPEKLAEQIKVLDDKPNVGIVYSRMLIVNEKGERLGTKPAEHSGRNFTELLEIWGDLPTSTVMTRRKCFDKAGLFDSSLVTMEDIDMWLRIARFFDLYEIEGKTLAYYFRHSDQLTASRIRIYEGLVKVCQKILRNFEDAPKDLFVKRIAVNLYTLSREYYFERFYLLSFKSVLASIVRYPLVGMLNFNPDDPFMEKTSKLIKPYGFLFVCLVKLCLASVFNAKVKK